jgi:hypothetical protein
MPTPLFTVIHLAFATLNMEHNNVSRNNNFSLSEYIILAKFVIQKKQSQLKKEKG